MLHLGNDDLVGFHLGPMAEHGLRDCKIFIGGDCVTDAKQEFLPDFRQYLVDEIETYRQTVNYLKHESDLLVFDNLTQIHNAFVHGDDDSINRLNWACSFLNWQIPLTDPYRAYLIPFRGRLWMTWQTLGRDELDFPVLDDVNGNEVNPHDLIDNFRECILTLENAG